MIRLRVQGIKVVVLRLDLRSIRQSKAQPMKNIDDSIQRLRDHMHRPRRVRFARQGGIDLPRCRTTLARPALPLLRPRFLQGFPKIVGRLARRRSLRRR